MMAEARTEIDASRIGRRGYLRNPVAYGEEYPTRVVDDAIPPTAPQMAPEEPQIPVRISRRQFRLHLLALGLLDTVEAWIDTQPLETQIAYESSSTFVRSDAMMQAGFDALGFETAQVDAFFVAAAQL
ncbi:hypothetical protein ACT6QH_01895 [Xanthobacter sp. TB0139]|uniref:hypothetical protein n=1 Tax=Xanthobacter sp. TB0139 TaxID=3459178 RepID=UPI004039872E